MSSVAIVIPCFNQGNFIHDSLRAALAQTYPDVEVVVIDDGSSDPTTVAQLGAIRDPRCRVIRTENHGLAAARNTGISNTKAKYIVPLDADDRIAPTFIEKALPVIEQNQSVGIVSCEAEFFGLHSGRWELKPYRFPDILLRSSLFATALFRRADWEKVGGYKEDMIHGYEDYDFWLSLIELGRTVYRIPEVLFSYRRSAGGMASKIDLEKKVFSYCKLYEHHQELYKANMEFLFRTFLEQDALLEVAHGPELIQVFLPSSRGYCEEHSVRTNFQRGDWKEISLESSAIVASLEPKWRIDPGISPGFYEIARVRIFNGKSSEILYDAGGGHLRQSARASGSAIVLPSSGNLRLFSFGTDPQFTFGPVCIPGNAKSLRIEILLRASNDLNEAADSFLELGCLPDQLRI